MPPFSYLESKNYLKTCSKLLSERDSWCNWLASLAGRLNAFHETYKTRDRSSAYAVIIEHLRDINRVGFFAREFLFRASTRSDSLLAPKWLGLLIVWFNLVKTRFNSF
jgi:hypothetical protein